MPQMAPIWWSSMFMLFISTYLLMMILMYFLVDHKKTNKKTEKYNINKMMNWKW